MNSFSPYRPHPWHGIPAGPQPPKIVTAFIEITSFDGIKYEIDKSSGYLKVDRPQAGSALPPALYGFIPQTYCAEKVAALSKTAKKGDGDPLDILVLSERLITKSEVLISARVIGGFRMLDRNEADDKIIAVLANDPYYKEVHQLTQIPKVLQDRLQHYFLTYKLLPGSTQKVKIEAKYGAKEAYRVITAAQQDYARHFRIVR